MASQEIEALANALARLPGLGPRSARRAVLHLMKRREGALQPLLLALQHVADRLSTCGICGNVDTSDPCTICRDAKRDPSILVVVEDVSDLWALERSGAINARYHVLGGVLSPLDGVRPEHLNLERLVARASEPGVSEVILALNATELLAHLPVKVTKLAHGVPVGGELDYLDEGTLSAAIRQRTSF